MGAGFRPPIGVEGRFFTGMRAGVGLALGIGDGWWVDGLGDVWENTFRGGSSWGGWSVA
jgi:hypothetical protein